MEQRIYDIIIIGGGPSGIACAIEAERNNLDYLILEKGVLVNSIYNFPTNMTFFSTSQKLEVGNIPFIAHQDKPTRREALEYYRRLVEGWSIKVKVYEEVLGLKPIENHYEITTSKGTYLTKHAIVATGFYDLPRLLNIPGEDLPKVKHYYDDAHPYVNQKIVVIGAKNSACDVALETFLKGADVTMVVRQDEIGPNVKYWIRPNVVNRIASGEIKAHFNSTVKEIRAKEVVIQTPEGDLVVENDFVLAMTGYQPNYAFFERLGIEIQGGTGKEPVMHPDTYETNLPGVYVAGVIQAGLNTSKLFIENTRHHGATIVGDILKKQVVTVSP